MKDNIYNIIITTKPARAQEAFGLCSQTCGLIFGGPLGTQDLDSMNLVGTFQLRIFYDSMIHRKNVYARLKQFRLLLGNLVKQCTESFL